MIYVAAILITLVTAILVALVLFSMAADTRRHRKYKIAMERSGHLAAKIRESHLTSEQKRVLTEFYVQLLSEEIPRGRKLTVWLGRYEQYMDATEHQIERANALAELN